MASIGTMAQLNDYSLCQQAVTVYRMEYGEVTRAVHPKAYLESKVAGTLGRTGDAQEGGFLLVIPGPEQACRVGDKVYDGVGPEPPAEDVGAWWRSLIPTKVDGLYVVRNVSVAKWAGVPVHTEAGG